MAKKKRTVKRDDVAQVVRLRLDHQYPEDMAFTRFANHMVVQRTEHDFQISFYQIQLPVVLSDDPEERVKILENLESVPARCVARVTVAAGRMPEIIEALQSNLDSAKKDDTNSDEKT